MNMKKLSEYLYHIIVVIELIILIPTIYAFIYAFSKGILSIYLAISIICILIFFLSLYIIYWTFLAPRVYYAHTKDESKIIIDKIYKKADHYVDRNKLINIYEANLQTTYPGTILNVNKDMAIKDRKATVRWKSVILKTAAKTQWIEEWKKEIWGKNTDCRLYIVTPSDNFEDYHLLNFLVIPEISEVYIGYGDYPGFLGGGIRIRSRKISSEIKGIIDNWAGVGQEVSR